MNKCTSTHQALQTSPMPDCMVLPPGEFNGKIPVPLPTYSKSLITIATAIFPRYYHDITNVTNTSD